jgi:hypothetical protein
MIFDAGRGAGTPDLPAWVLFEPIRNKSGWGMSICACRERRALEA